jgi:hypothetical protein
MAGNMKSVKDLAFEMWLEDAKQEYHERKAKKMGVTKVLEWRLTQATEMRFLELMSQIEQTEAGSDAEAAIVEEVRSLPGFPAEAGPDTFTRRILTDVQH